jgi:hypothetical protein
MSTKVRTVQSDHSSLRHHHAAPASVITDARGSSSVELSGRVKRYTLAMAFRMACFLSMVFVDGWLRWTLLAFAVFLPYVAVVLANQADERSTGSRIEHGAPEDAPQLTTGSDADVIEGDVVDTEDETLRAAA